MLCVMLLLLVLCCSHQVDRRSTTITSCCDLPACACDDVMELHAGYDMGSQPWFDSHSHFFLESASSLTLPKTPEVIAGHSSVLLW